MLYVDRKVLLNAAGLLIDAMGLHFVGLSCVWLNRFNDRLVGPHSAPMFKVPDLAYLPEALSLDFICGEIMP